MLHKKTLAALGLVVSAALFATACGSTASVEQAAAETTPLPSPTATATAAPTATPTPTPSPTPAPAPDEDAVLAMRETVLAGMPQDQRERMAEFIKAGNHILESDVLSKQLSYKFQDPDSLYWNLLDETGEVQIGWANSIADEVYRSTMSEEEFYAQYGTPVVTENQVDADRFIEILSEFRAQLPDTPLQADLDTLAEYTRAAQATHDIDYLRKIHRMLHDMDYYLMRYAPANYGPPSAENSTIYTYYGVLQVWQNAT